MSQLRLRPTADGSMVAADPVPLDGSACSARTTPTPQGDIIGVPACSKCRNYRPKPQPIDRPEVPDQTGLLVCTIPLTQKKVALVDAVDYERVNRYRWCAGRVGNQWYAYRKHYGKTLRMHQFIMNPPKGMVVDHANGNGLDNRRDNLRLCTKLENAWNHGRRKEEEAGSRYIGVYPCQRPPGKWCIKVQCNGAVTNLGSFDTPEEAAAPATARPSNSTASTPG